MKPDQVLGMKIWIVILAACVISVVPYVAAGFNLTSLSFFAAPAIGVICSRLLMRYRETFKIGAVIDGLFQMMFVSFVGAMLCYAAATMNSALIDGDLLRFDRAIGYDWLEYARFVNVNPVVRHALNISYMSYFIQPFFLSLILILTGGWARYEMFIISMLLGLTLTALIFAIFPATTAWTYLGQEALASSSLRGLPVSSGGWIAELLEIRAGGGRIISNPEGIVAFPSFHCVMALLNIRAAWPVRPARLPFLILNGLMIASAPLVGGHYVADLIAGGFVALAAVVLGEKAHRWICGKSFPIAKILEPEPVALRAHT